MFGSSLAPKWPILVPLYRMYHQKSIFLLILAPFLSEAVEASQCYLFENWLMKLKCPNLLKPLGTIILENYWSFYLSEPFRIIQFNMRHPVAHAFFSYSLVTNDFAHADLVHAWISVWPSWLIMPSTLCTLYTCSQFVLKIVIRTPFLYFPIQDVAENFITVMTLLLAELGVVLGRPLAFYH